MKRYTPTLEAFSWANVDDHDTDVYADMVEDQRGEWVRIEEANPATMYPALHAIGLGPQLAELERICAQSQTGKHAGESIHDPGVVHHLENAANHLGSSGVYPSERDPDSGALHLVHAAARLLMAAACVDREKAGNK